VPCLPARIQLQHLRDQADSLLRDAGGGDQAALAALLTDHPEIAYTPLEHWCDQTLLITAASYGDAAALDDISETG
jgi:hypothetical protein